MDESIEWVWIHPEDALETLELNKSVRKLLKIAIGKEQSDTI